MRKPCIDCGTPTQGTRCPPHQLARRGSSGWAQQATNRNVIAVAGSRCQHCGDAGPLEVHHVTSSRLRVLCVRCHDAETAIERGYRR